MANGRWGSGNTTNGQAYKDLDTMLSFFAKAQSARKSDLKYKSEHELVMKLGKKYETKPLPKDLKRGKPKLCYENASKIAISQPDKYDYVEGFAITKTSSGYEIPIPIGHAWLVDKSDGKAIEVTWQEQGAAYKGIEVNRTYLAQTLIDTETYGTVLMSFLKKGVPQKAKTK